MKKYNLFIILLLMITLSCTTTRIEKIGNPSKADSSFAYGSFKIKERESKLQGVTIHIIDNIKTQDISAKIISDNEFIFESLLPGEYYIDLVWIDGTKIYFPNLMKKNQILFDVPRDAIVNIGSYELEVKNHSLFSSKYGVNITRYNEIDEKQVLDDIIEKAKNTDWEKKLNDFKKNR